MGSIVVARSEMDPTGSKNGSSQSRALICADAASEMIQQNTVCTYPIGNSWSFACIHCDLRFFNRQDYSVHLCPTYIQELLFAVRLACKRLVYPGTNVPIPSSYEIGFILSYAHNRHRYTIGVIMHIAQNLQWYFKAEERANTKYEWSAFLWPKYYTDMVNVILYNHNPTIWGSILYPRAYDEKEDEESKNQALAIGITVPLVFQDNVDNSPSTSANPIIEKIVNQIEELMLDETHFDPRVSISVVQELLLGARLASKRLVFPERDRQIPSIYEMKCIKRYLSKNYYSSMVIYKIAQNLRWFETATKIASREYQWQSDSWPRFYPMMIYLMLDKHIPQTEFMLYHGAPYYTHESDEAQRHIVAKHKLDQAVLYACNIKGSIFSSDPLENTMKK